jgi:hypothetical protein
VSQEPASSLIDKRAYERYALLDAIGAALAGGQCCSSPALVLGRVLFTQNPRELGSTLRSHASMYTILLDGYPYRRVIAPAALDFYLAAASRTTKSDSIVASGIVGSSALSPYPNTEGAYPIRGGLTVSLTNPLDGITSAADGQIFVSFNGYSMPNSTKSYAITAIPATGPIPFGSAPPTYTVSLSKFYPSAIQFTVTEPGGSVDVPTKPVSATLTLPNVYFAFEITQIGT